MVTTDQRAFVQNYSVQLKVTNYVPHTFGRHFLMSVCVHIHQMQSEFSWNLKLWSFNGSYIHILNLVNIVRQRSRYVNAIHFSRNLKRNSSTGEIFGIQVTDKHTFYVMPCDSSKTLRVYLIKIYIQLQESGGGESEQ